MKKHHQRTLVLNNDYQALAITPWQNAIKLIWKHRGNKNIGLEIIDFYKHDFILGTEGRKYPIPAVARRPRYVSNKKRRIPFSRPHVFTRDQLTCQYCGFCNGKTNLLTYDHVIPREEWKKNQYVGTPTSWTNIVTCCRRCNHKKSNRSLDGSGMKLKKMPIEPGCQQYVLGLGPWDIIPEEWIQYLPPLYKNICEIIKEYDYG